MTLAFTPAEVLTSARDRSPFFDASRIPGGTALRLYFEAERALLAKVEARDPRAVQGTALTTLTSSQVIAVLGGQFGIDPMALVPNAAAPTIFDVFYSLASDLTTDQLRRLEQVDYESLLTYGNRSYSVQDGSLYFGGSVGDWAPVATLTVYGYQISADPDRTDSVTSALQYVAKDALVARVAESFARRLDGTPVSLEAPDFSQMIRMNLDSFQQVTQRAEYEYLKQITAQRNRGAITIPNGVEFQP